MSLFKKLFVQIKNTRQKFSICKGDFSIVSEDIRRTNLVSLTAISFILTVLFFILVCASFIFDEPILITNKYTYYILFIGQLFVFLSAETFLRKKRKLILPFCYLFLLLIDFYSFAVGTVTHPENYAVAIVTTIFVAPILFCDRAVRMNAFSIFVELVFIFVVFKTKKRSAAVMDMLNSASFCLISCFVCLYMNYMRVNDYLLRKVIKNERDYDGLTAVLNKVAFNRKVSHLDAEGGALFIIDIDNFKVINDTYGHLTGDFVIQSIASCLRKSFRATDLIGRFGGDEFVVFMPAADSESLIEQKADNIVNFIKNTVYLPEKPKTATVSIGVAISKTNKEKYDSLFKKADIALYKAKSAGKCTFDIIK